jgi:hypothetical protein
MSGIKCGELAGALVEMARGGPLTAAERAALGAHLRECDTCGRKFNAQKRLSAATGVLALEAGRLTVPSRVERALEAEMRTVRGYRRSSAYAVWGAAIAASLAVAWWFAGSRTEPKLAVGRQTPTAPVAAAKSQSLGTETMTLVARRHKRRARHAAEPELPFIAIPYTLPLEPYERADVMRMDIPVAALIAVGLPMHMTDPASRARADVVVGQDGRARAIRLISISAPDFRISN